MSQSAKSLSIFVLTRFSVLSTSKGHSWNILQKPYMLRARKLFRLPNKNPSLEEKRRYLFDEQRLQYRLGTFEKFTLPSLANQEDKDFRHLVLTSVELPTDTRNRLEELAERYGFEIVAVPIDVAFEDFLATRSDLASLDSAYVATLRIDDDDALGKGVIRRLRSLAPSGVEDIVASWPKGFMVTDHGDDRYSVREVEKPSLACGLTRVRAASSITPTVHACGNHRYVSRHFPFVTFPDENAFLMTNHGDNISVRRSRRRNIPLNVETRERIREQFGVEL